AATEAAALRAAPEPAASTALAAIATAASRAVPAPVASVGAACAVALTARSPDQGTQNPAGEIRPGGTSRCGAQIGSGFAGAPAVSRISIAAMTNVWPVGADRP